MITVTNRNGRKFNINIVLDGGQYYQNLLDNTVTYKNEGALVEFYDATYAGVKGFPELGQFVSRYFASTLKEGSIGGLCLDGGVPEWFIDKGNLIDILKHIEQLGQ